jgi:phosphatidylserine/phosphatidylglycerophosphate/cardiolipin synthase-like enzyme
VPLDTTLGFDDVPDTADVWRSMIDSARERIDVSMFYLSHGPALEPLIAALEAALGRGVRLRLLVDASFADEYPEMLTRLEARGAALVRWQGDGVLHNKYLIVDRHDCYIGSANMDHRALEHIHELGVRIDSREFATSLGSVFERDWRGDGDYGAWPTVTLDGATLTLLAGPSAPPNHVELPRLVAAIDGARRRIVIQLLGYDAAYRDGRPFAALDDALRRAAARGVTLSLLISDWQRDHAEALRALDALEGVEVRLVTIPEHASGPIPFARVVHAKYMVVDDTRAWIGSSNWKGDYFFMGRNVGVLLEGGALPGLLRRSFEQLWVSGYASGAW